MGEPEKPLHGSVAVVTGGSRGIGRAIVSRLRAQGATVAIGDVQPEPDASADLVARLDVADDQSCLHFVERVCQRLGGIDVLVNNAGINLRRDAADTEPAQWRRILDVNLGGTFQMCRAALTPLSVKPGCVVNLGSTGGIKAIPGSAAYGVSKAAVLHLTKLLAVEWADRGIRVNAVAPTIVPTEMTADVLADPEYMREKWDSIPLRRIPRADEVAAAALFLCLPEAATVTGQMIVVDGGTTIS